LLSSIVVNKNNVRTGELDPDSLKGFIGESAHENSCRGRPQVSAGRNSKKCLLGRVPTVANERSGTGGGMAAKVFISYAHKDEPLRNELQVHLAMLDCERDSLRFGMIANSYRATGWIGQSTKI